MEHDAADELNVKVPHAGGPYTCLPNRRKCLRQNLVQHFARTGAWQVQNAIAGVLLRADPAAIARREVLRTLREYRVKSLPEGNMVDALIERLQLS